MTYYSDSDDDGFGDEVTEAQACALPTGVLQSGDCDDLDPTVSPGMPEVCDS